MEVAELVGVVDKAEVAAVVALAAVVTVEVVLVKVMEAEETAEVVEATAQAMGGKAVGVEVMVSVVGTLGMVGMGGIPVQGQGPPAQSRSCDPTGKERQWNDHPQTSGTRTCPPAQMKQLHVERRAAARAGLS